MRDRTQEFKELNDELEARVLTRTNELTHINRKLKRLSYVAAHDLKGPVNNMASLTHMLEDAAAGQSEEYAETLGWMRDACDDACDQAAQKLEGLVVVAQSNAMPDAPFVDVDLAGVIDRISVNLHYALTENKAVLRSDPDHGAVRFLPQQVENIQQALISNAMKYRVSDRPPRITVRCQRSAGFIVVTVSDNGQGLDLPRDREKVFGLFQRAHVAPSGAGVALCTIRRIMERIGGAIDAESRSDRDAISNCSFPAPARRGLTMPRPLNRILPVDDDTVTNLMHRRQIARSELADVVDVATDGRAALDYLTEGEVAGNPQPELVLLDINMQRMNGFEFLTEYAMLPESLHRSQSVVMLSTSARKTSAGKQDRMRAEADDLVKSYGVKPLAADDFCRTVGDYHPTSGAAG